MPSPFIPDAFITIEGHTDAYGTDATNLTLSQDPGRRGDPVLAGQFRPIGKQGEAVGYGEAKPIANNETKEGRAKNRRIDIVIKPAK